MAVNDTKNIKIYIIGSFACSSAGLLTVYALFPGFSVVCGNEARYSKAFWISGGIGGGVGRWAPEN